MFTKYGSTSLCIYLVLASSFVAPSTGEGVTETALECLNPWGKKPNEGESCAWSYAGAAIGAAVAVPFVPAAVGAMGFGQAGIVAGTIGAKMMSAAAATGIGGAVVGAFQSVGAAGLGTVGTAAASGVGATVGSYLFGGWFCGDSAKKDDKK